MTVGKHILVTSFLTIFVISASAAVDPSGLGGGETDYIKGRTAKNLYFSLRSRAAADTDTYTKNNCTVKTVQLSETKNKKNKSYSAVKTYSSCSQTACMLKKVRYSCTIYRDYIHD